MNSVQELAPWNRIHHDRTGGNLLEPTDKDNMEWKDWFVRHTFGPMVAISIKAAQIKDLDILIDFARDIQRSKKDQSE